MNAIASRVAVFSRIHPPEYAPQHVSNGEQHREDWHGPCAKVARIHPRYFLSAFQVLFEKTNGDGSK